MEGDFTGPEVYQQHFNPKDYLQRFTSFGSGDTSVCGTAFTFILDKLHMAFGQDGIRGDTLIDMGSGPTIYQLLSACESFREIIATDYTDQNREEMQKWLKKDPEAFDWTPMVKYVCQLEGDREKWMEKEEKLRNTIKQVLKCDVTQANPLHPLVLQPASCVLSILCLNVASKDLPTYRSAMKNVGSLVKPGGHLILVEVHGVSFYVVGQQKFSALYLTPEIVEDVVKEAGFNIVRSETVSLYLPQVVTDGKDIFFLVAQKPMET